MWEISLDYELFRVRLVQSTSITLQDSETNCYQLVFLPASIALLNKESAQFKRTRYCALERLLEFVYGKHKHN